MNKLVIGDKVWALDSDVTGTEKDKEYTIVGFCFDSGDNHFWIGVNAGNQAVGWFPFHFSRVKGGKPLSDADFINDVRMRVIKD